MVNMIDRELYIKTWKELSRNKSMVFVVGPRQSGKTTLAHIIGRSFTNSLYFNWDIAGQRTRLIENPNFFESVDRKDSSPPLIVFDEIHKYRKWKSYLKGVYDQFHDQYQFLVSGSGRLDIYQKGGDSLAGRYLQMHLWPLTVAELGRRNHAFEDFRRNPVRLAMERRKELKETWMQLSSLSGFPEPYLSGRMTSYRRWSSTYSLRIIREDIRDLTGIKSVGDVETLYLLMPSRVGSPLSIPSLSRDLRVSYNSISSWLAVFQRFFLVFSIAPWTRRIARAVHKERKVYLFDAPLIREPAARFENMVALELWRAVTSWNDLGYGSFSLHFIRNKERQEVDFLLAEDNEPLLLVEAKMSDPSPSPALKKFQRALGVPAVQLTMEGEGFKKFMNEGRSIVVTPAYLWLSTLP
jgi:predicted AAA+ superfamily ATPase